MVQNVPLLPDILLHCSHYINNLQYGNHFQEYDY
ncbi:hypothetical protein YPPY89_2856, partial [Yersinia pestis PY-89]